MKRKELVTQIWCTLQAVRRQQETLRRTGMYTLGGLGAVLVCYAAYKAYQSLQSSQLSSEASPNVETHSRTD